MEAMAEKKRTDRGGNSSSIEDNRYYNSDMYSTNPD